MWEMEAHLATEPKTVSPLRKGLRPLFERGLTAIESFLVSAEAGEGKALSKRRWQRLQNSSV